MSEDPLTFKYPELTPYQFASNTPIAAIDLDGLERLIVNGTQWNDSDGKIQQNVNTTFYGEENNNNQELDREGVQLTLNGQTTFFEPIVVTAKRTKSFSQKSQENAIWLMYYPISAGKYIEGNGDRIKEAGFGYSQEIRGGVLYEKSSYERYSTHADNVGTKAKHELGVRVDADFRYFRNGKPEVRGPKKSWDETNFDKLQVETRLYFHMNSEKTSTPVLQNRTNTLSLSSTTKLPIWLYGGVYYNYDALSSKSEFGFYFSSNRRKFAKFQEGGTFRVGIKDETISPTHTIVSPF